MIVAFIGSLNFYAQSRERMQKQNLRKARRFKRHIEKTLKSSTRPNILPLTAILEAEELSYQKKTDPEVLARHFDKAFEASATAGFVHMEALANERARALLSDIAAIGEGRKCSSRIGLSCYTPMNGVLQIKLRG
jgi:hypothetical protein